MFAINVLKSLSKSFSTKLRATVFFLKQIKHNSYKTKPVTSFEIKSHVENDVTLFHYENPAYFLKINFLSATVCAFWTYMGVFFIQELKKSSVSFESRKLWEKIIDIEHKYSKTLGAVAVIFGWSAFIATLLYSVRSIRKIILHKGGKYVTIVTYNLPGYNSFKVPLSSMSSFQHRAKASKYVAIKIKNKYFYYLIDVTGEFSNPALFDFTVGLKRTL